MKFRFLIFLLLIASPVFASSVDDYEDAEFEVFEVSNPTKEIRDPYEKANRKIYAFNDAFDRYFFERVARTYRKTVPERGRDSIHNFLNNLSLPISMVNSIAQGKVDNALATFSSFLINSTVGFGGLFNVSGEKGVFYKPEDFGQTLGHYGFNSGPYLVLPFLGPSSIRDFGGFVFDRSIDPVGFNVFDIGGRSFKWSSGYAALYVSIYGIDTREGLLDVVDDVRRDSFDPYATVRSAYLQKRVNEIKN